MAIRFCLDDEIMEVEDVDPTSTALDFLRYRLRRTGTKEGCAEGDCGACTVLIGDLVNGKIAWRAVNSCILFMPMLHGRALMTVESLSRGGAMTPLQQQMAENGSSQCGFCTPGFVMSLHGRSIGASGCKLPVSDVVAGNLCRCTGYGAILEAGEAHPPGTPDDSRTVDVLARLDADEGISGSWQGRHWHVPATADELTALLAEHPDARIVSGATDIGLWVTKGLQSIDRLIFLHRIAELREVEESAEGVRLGATVSVAQTHEVLSRAIPSLGELFRRFGGLQIRNAGTIGGNVANGSPIGDSPPALIALGATLTLRSVEGRRDAALDGFFLDYGKQDRRPGEYVESIFVPRPPANAICRFEKLSKRFDSDISAVCGAFNLIVQDGIVESARIAFGGMAAVPKRAVAVEEALAGAPFTLESLEAAAEKLSQDFSPISDARGSADYRLDVAGNLLRRLWFAQSGEAVSVLEVEALHG